MEAPLEGFAVSFLGRMFNSSPAPSPGGRGAEVNAFVEELNRIGLAEGFLAFRPGGRFNQQCRHIRAREIGMRLNLLGGSRLMRAVYDRVDCPKARQLAAAWDEIGDWIT